jgi:hypothetical protein
MTSVATLDSSGPGVLQDLVQPLDLPAALLDLGLAVAGQLAQLPDRLGRHEAGADQAVLDQLGDPGGVGHIGLATRHVVHVRRVQQPTLDLVLQQLPDRLPVAPGRLHPHPGHPEAAQPLGQQHQPGGRRGEPAGLGVAPAVVVRHPHAGGHRVLVHVQASATRNQRLHLLALLHLGNGRHPEEPLPEESESRARGNSSECPRLPRQTYQRARGTKERRRWPDDRHIFIRRGWPATAMGGLSGTLI